MMTPITIVQRATRDLTPYAHNPRKNDQAVDRMVSSIREFGFKIPILCMSDGLVIDGHLRLKAAQQLGITDVPAILCDEWSEAQVKAFRLMANRSVTWAAWDEALLSQEVQELQAMQYDLAHTGFDEAELKSLLKRSEQALQQIEQDEIPSRYEILVICRDESQQAALLTRLNEEGYECRALLS